MEPTQCVLFVGLQVLVVFVSFAPVFIAGQAGKDFLTWSIDCGSNRNYTDDVTGIPWVTDEAFIQTGTNARNVTVYPSDYAYVNKGQMSTLRYFDDSRTRHCYVLPVKARITYLLRPTFFLGNLTDLIKRDISFRLYFNATDWLELPFYPDSDYNLTWSYEAIIYSPGAVLNICLVKDYDKVAFISTLELREFTTGMYSSAAAGGYQFQAFRERINVGVTPPADHVLTYLRFPDDPYDRIWWSPGSWDDVPRIKNNRTSSSSVQLQNRPPNVVMNDAWTRNDTDTLYFSSESDYNSIIGPIVTYSYVMEFGENGSAVNKTSIQYAVNGILIDTFNASSVPQEIISSITVPESYYNMTFTPTNGSTSPAVLNALEVYNLYSTDNSYTAVTDVNSIADAKKDFNLIDWSGDPCLPYPYDWLQCTSFEATSASKYYYVSEYRITGLALVSATNAATERNALAKITGLTNLTYLDLSRNSLKGRAISFALITNLTVLNVSNNFFDGEVVDFVRSANISNVRELNLSGNQFSSFSRKQSSPLFKNLTKLDLSRNYISGEVMNFITSIPENSITELYAGNNVLEGQFTTSQLSAQFDNIQIVDFDNQKISGTLDLSNWTLNNMMTQLIKLRNNSIENVYPPLDVLSWTIIDNVSPGLGSVQAYRGGILLSGNPWCRTANNKTLGQRYLCRNDLKDYVDYSLAGVARPDSGETNWKEIIGIGVGASTFIIFCMIGFAIMLRKLRKKSRALAEIQVALTRQKVHPPLYSYAELRTATKNFAYDNNLGQGAYGAVYRGKLVDGTQVAVKKLFKDSQVLAEFLNEAVLITGIKHRNLAQLKGCCIDQEQRILVYEYAENGNLAEALWGEPDNEKTRKHQTKGPMSWKMRLNICTGIARGLSYLHEELQPRIIHRDIKPANILIDVNFNVKIADFGLARSFLEEQTRAEYTHLAGTFGYLAPEYIMQGQLTEKVDVYSCGVVFLEIVSGRKCIDQSLPPERVSLVRWADTLRKKGHVVDILDSSIKSNFDEVEILRVIDIAFSCLDVEPFKRPTMSQVVTILQGNASSFKRPLPSFCPFSGSPGTKFSRFGAARSLSLGSGVARSLPSESASFTHDSSDQLAFLLDQTSRSQDLEMSSISGR